MAIAEPAIDAPVNRRKSSWAASACFSMSA